LLRDKTPYFSYAYDDTNPIIPSQTGHEKGWCFLYAFSKEGCNIFRRGVLCPVNVNSGVLCMLQASGNHVITDIPP
jgi:hypothetical protein